jgi:3-hydroxyisobutyrate dehydrogenase-like beta-hydroxyacid dehydrogenase
MSSPPALSTASPSPNTPLPHTLRLHFVGIGKMGLPMATHLLKAGYAVTVTDANPASEQAARALGLTVAHDANHAITQANIIFSSLPHDTALRAVGQQVAAHARSGALYIDTSTVSLEVSAQVAQACAAHDVAYLRATVSGNNKMAEAAQLTVMASGTPEAYARALPLFKTWGPNQFYLGAGEQARLMKLVVNLMIVQTSAMLAEALTLGRKGGLEWQTMWRVLGSSAVASPIVKAKSAQLAVRDFSPTFTVEQMQKDVSLILNAGETLGAPLAQTMLTQAWMQQAVAAGEGGEDYATIIKGIERLAGLDPTLAV